MGLLKIPKERYDAIVIGAGVNGLSLGLNLAKSGLQTLIVDRDSSVGGQATTEEPMLAGFRVHPHANYLSFSDLIATQSYPSCRAMNAPCVMPLAQHGLCFRDGRAPLIIYRSDCKDRTRRSLANYSSKDARTFERCKSLAEKTTPSLARLYFSAPNTRRFAEFLMLISASFRGLLRGHVLGRGDAKTLIDRLFESDEVRTLFYLLSMEFSGNLNAPGSDASFLSYVLWLLGRRTLPIGGMFKVPERLADAAVAAGADLLLNTHVERVVIEAGAARGVMLADTRFVSAGMVASSAGHGADLERLVGRAELGPSEIDALSRFESAEANMIGSYAACLRDPPHYKCAEHNPDINHCAQTFIGLDSTSEVLAFNDDLQSGRLPVPAGASRVNSLWDSTQAPAGCHVAGADCAFPSGLDQDYQDSLALHYPSAFAKMWADYAPNVSENILAQRICLGSASTRKLMLREGDSQYRGPSAGLYLCGASSHPGGGVHGACGVNAFQVMMADWSRSAILHNSH